MVLAKAKICHGVSKEKAKFLLFKTKKITITYGYQYTKILE